MTWYLCKCFPKTTKSIFQSMQHSLALTEQWGKDSGTPQNHSLRTTLMHPTYMSVHPQTLRRVGHASRRCWWIWWTCSQWSFSPKPTGWGEHSLYSHWGSVNRWLTQGVSYEHDTESLHFKLIMFSRAQRNKTEINFSQAFQWTFRTLAREFRFFPSKLSVKKMYFVIQRCIVCRETLLVSIPWPARLLLVEETCLQWWCKEL